MRFLIDENLSSPRLGSRLRAQGHDPILAGDVGLLSIADPRVLIWAIGQGLPVLTRDSDDFEALHDLVMAAGGHHTGLLTVRFDSDPRHNMSDRAIGLAITKLEASGLPIFGSASCPEPVALIPSIQFGQGPARGRRPVAT
jgi:predicted nuclease of predicted toxin-antitoxin system